MEKILLDELSNIISAYKEGKTLQFYTSYSGFKDVSAEEFDIEKWYKEPKKFRIKPEVKYRPFKDAEECWQEMRNHQPVGFMKFKDTESGYYMLTGIARGVGVGINDSLFSYDRVFDDYTFADGLPFGVKMEE